MSNTFINTFVTDKFLSFIKDNFPPALLISLQKEDCYLCGGSLVSFFSDKLVKDFDIYFRDKESFKTIDSIFSHYTSSRINNNRYVSETAITYRYSESLLSSTNTYQLIKKPSFFLPGLLDVLETFDFKCCMVGYSFKSNNIVSEKSFTNSLVNKKIIYNTSSASKYNIIKRLDKYIKKDYTIGFGELVKIFYSLQKYSLTLGEPKEIAHIKNCIKLMEFILNKNEYERPLIFKSMKLGEYIEY